MLFGCWSELQVRKIQPLVPINWAVEAAPTFYLKKLKTSPGVIVDILKLVNKEHSSILVLILFLFRSWS